MLLCINVHFCLRELDNNNNKLLMNAFVASTTYKTITINEEFASFLTITTSSSNYFNFELIF